MQRQDIYDELSSNLDTNQFVPSTINQRRKRLQSDYNPSQRQTKVVEQHELHQPKGKLSFKSESISPDTERLGRLSDGSRLDRRGYRRDDKSNTESTDDSSSTSSYFFNQKRGRMYSSSDSIPDSIKSRRTSPRSIKGAQLSHSLNQNETLTTPKANSLHGSPRMNLKMFEGTYFIDADMFVTRNKTLLSKITNKTEYGIVYDSDKHTLSAKSFNSKVCNQSNIMLLFFVGDKVFGCFTSSLIPKPPNTLWTFVEDDDFTLFSMSDSTNASTSYVTFDMNQFVAQNIETFKRKSLDDEDNSYLSGSSCGVNQVIRIYPNTEKIRVVEVTDCVIIKNDGNSCVSYFINHFYDMKGESRTILVGSYEPTMFRIGKLVAVKWG